MSAPICTPLLTVSAFNAATNQSESTRLLDQIVHASALLQGACNRRFDEYVADVRYTAKRVTSGGDLLDGWRLSLNADLKSLTTLAVDIPFGGTIASGTPVTDATEIIESEDVGGAPANSGRELMLDAYAGITGFVATGNPRKSIGVRGVWGFGGQWVQSTTLSSAISNTTATSVTVTSGSAFEAGMVIKVDSEYLYISVVNTNTLTVTRAYNGSTAASHLDTTPVYYFEAHPLVQRLVRRLVQWDEEQKKAPLLQNVAVADFSLPAATDGLPKDVYDTIALTGLSVLRDRIVKA